MRGRQTDTIFRFSGPAGPRLQLSAREIFAQLGRSPLPPPFFGIGQSTFSTIGKPGGLDGAVVRFALVFRVIRHQRVITDRTKIEKSPSPSS